MYYRYIFFKSNVRLAAHVLYQHTIITFITFYSCIVVKYLLWRYDLHIYNNTTLHTTGIRQKGLNIKPLINYVAYD